MSHGGDSCAGVVGSAVGGAGHKKLRRKRKELDALVPEDKVRRKFSSASHHDLLHSDSEDPEADFVGVAVVGKRLLGGGREGAGFWACLPGVCTLLLLLTTLVGVAAALRLLMLTRRDLDSLHSRINTDRLRTERCSPLVFEFTCSVCETIYAVSTFEKRLDVQSG